ncbi:MAG: prolyl oligopeptidase family serine peptidase [Actinomycetota bacterium]
MAEVRPYGSWRSPIDAALLTGGKRGFGLPRIDGADVYYTESRPAEGGRVTLMRRSPGRAAEEVVAPSVNARTSVHEYGGGAYVVRDGVVVHASFDDQRLYRVERGAAAVAITPEPPAPRSHRYADGAFSRDGRWMVWVRERHDADGVVNELVRVTVDGSAPPVAIASGRDFYSTPRFSPDGSRLAFLAWDQPNMPWDGTDLLVADVLPDGSLGQPRHVAGGPDESIFQPAWSPDGVLHFVSDRTGWWNLHRDEPGGARNLAPRAEEFGTPQWLFAYSTYGFLDDGRIVCRRETADGERVGVLDPTTGELIDLDLPFEVVGPFVATQDARVALVVGGPHRPPTVVALDLRAADVEIVAEGDRLPIDVAYLSTPRPIAFPTEGGATAYAYFYPPTNPDFTAPAGELPPLLVLSHGGPTAATDVEFDLDKQFFTSRGFAVVDVNYGGSTGYGRDYRRRLNGMWGVVDTQDCANAARFLTDQGLVDPARVVASGGSAGGWTTLCLLAFTDVCAAGTSYYGVADLLPFVDDTHKFEARYFDSLVGPWPASRPLYEERSPLRHAERLSRPMLVLQGLDDRVVPPAQSELLVAALAAKGIPHAYIAYEGEGHGFRKAENIVRSLESELSFYAQVLGFPHPEGVPVLPLVER